MLKTRAGDIIGTSPVGTSLRIIRRPEVERRTGKSRSSIYEKMAKGKFPKPVHLGPRAVGWVEQEIDQHIAAKIAERNRQTAEGGR